MFGASDKAGSPGNFADLILVKEVSVHTLYRSVQGHGAVQPEVVRECPTCGDHKLGCLTCHAGGNYKAYTCYGCHTHEKSRMISEHQEEGILNIDNCVRCHKGRGLRAGEGRESGDDD